MEQSVVSKLKQLAEELFMLQQICHAQIWQRMENKKHWRRCVERLGNDVRESRARIVDLLNCPQIRKHIQSLGSHACGEFAKIHDLLPGYPLQILRWFSNEKHFNKWHLVEDEHAWASGWRELSQLSEWLLLIAGAMNEGPYLGLAINGNEVERIGFDESVDLNRKAQQRRFMEILLALRGTPIVRDELLDMIYSSTPSSSALSNLRSALNKSLEPLRVEVDKQNVLVDISKPTTKQTAGKPTKKKTR